MSFSMPAESILPASAVLETTYRCNHKCLFCSCPWYTGMLNAEKEMEFDEWCELIETYARAGVMHFTFTGGESLLKERLIELIEFTKQVKAVHIETIDGELKRYEAPPGVNLLSNGKLVDENILKLCAKHKINLSISLPGLKTFEEHTGGAQKAEDILNIFAAAKEFAVTTTAGITVTSKNFHELYETIAAALIAGADTILLNRFMPGGRGLDNRNLELTTEQIRQMPYIAESVLEKAKRYGSIGTELPRCIVNPSEFKYLKVGTGCSAASEFFVVGPNGKLRVCNHSPIELVRWRDYESLKENEVWNQFVFKKWRPSHCNGCGYTSECAGGCREAARVTTGSVSDPDPLWRGNVPGSPCP